MSLRLGAPRVALVVAPHADDEVIGAAGLIHALRRRGTAVHVLVVTDGAASHPRSEGWPRRRLVAERMRESRRAVRRLGITAGRLAFLGQPDGSLASEPGRCRHRIGRAIARMRQLDLIVGPASDDAHPDHRTVAAAIVRAGRVSRRLTYRVWPAGKGGGPSAWVRFPAGHAGKRSLIRCYRTQTGTIADDPSGFAIAPHEMALFAHPIERFCETRR